MSPKSRLTFERWDVRLRMDAVKRMGLSLSLSLRGIVMYDVGVVGRDTVYLPTYLHEIRDFAPLIRDPFLSFERSMRYVDNRIIEKGGREILRVSSRGGTRNQSSSRRLAPKIVPHCEYNGGA